VPEDRERVEVQLCETNTNRYVYVGDLQRIAYDAVQAGKDTVVCSRSVMHPS
jgi:hypothetical protein